MTATTTPTTRSATRSVRAGAWGHVGEGWQNWEERIADGKFVRDHASQPVNTEYKRWAVHNPVSMDV